MLIKEQDNEKGKWKLSSFPGCNGLIISHGAFIDEKWRRLGLGNLEHEKRIKIAKDLNYSCMIATVVNTNEIEKKILIKNKWQIVYEFFNKKTNHRIEIWVKDI